MHEMESVEVGKADEEEEKGCGVRCEGAYPRYNLWAGKTYVGK